MSFSYLYNLLLKHTFSLLLPLTIAVRKYLAESLTASLIWPLHSTKNKKEVRNLILYILNKKFLNS